jgi:hypothetical protein
MTTRKTTAKITTEHKSVWEALHAARADFTTITKSAVNPHFKSRYATLTDVMNATMPALQKHGLVMYQSPSMIDGSMMLVSRIVHASTGECIEDWMPLSAGGGKNPVQSFGSELSYKKRYMMAAQLCVTDGLDDDGNTVETSTTAATTQSTQSGTAKKKTPSTGQKTVVTTSDGVAQWQTGLSPADIRTIESWKAPADATTWCVNIGGADDDDGAAAFFRAIVHDEFGNQLKQSNMREVFAAFFKSVCSMLSDDETAAISIDDVEELPF